MATIKELISSVRNSIKSINVDDRVSNRYIYSLLVSYANSLIKRDNDQRRLFNQTHLFKTVNCFELEEAPLIDCSSILIPSCKKVMRSKQPLPKTYSTEFGGILDVYSVDFSINYLERTPIAYKTYTAREFKPVTSGTFWIHNNYLVIPDSDVEAVSLRGFFENQEEIDKLNGVKKAACSSKLDQEFMVPQYLIADILRSVVTDVRNITLPIPEDNVPNRNQGEKQVALDNE